MPAARNGCRSLTSSYHRLLRLAMDGLLPRELVPLQWDHHERRWKPRLLALCALLMNWDSSVAAQDRFDNARRLLIEMYPGRLRPGRSYNGFMDALAEFSQESLPRLQQHLQEQMRLRLGVQWQPKRWVIFGVDGSKLDLPDTQANEQTHGCAGKRKSGPQLLQTTLFHLLSGLPWAFVSSGARGSEREQLRQMLDSLPPEALLVADAGFTGYELMAELLRRKLPFLIRVGANVKLLKKLGFARGENAQTVYLWPDKQQEKNHPPLVLRLIRIVKGRGRRRRGVYLLTNVLDARQLSDAEAGRIYRLRWGVEVGWRGLKQTMQRRKLRSTSPQRATVELAWSMMGLWVLGLLSVEALGRRGVEIGRWSVAASLRVLRRILRHPRRCAGRGGLWGRLGRATKDAYQRRGSKQARHRRDKKKDRPPGRPRARNARKAEIRLAQQLRQRRTAA